MELTETLFAEITGVSAQPPIYNAVIDRRVHPRVMFGCRARIFPLMETVGGNGCPVLIRDLSRSGIGFMFSHPLEAGDEFIVHLPRQSGPVVQIMCMAQRCEPGGVSGKEFIIGATLELVLDSSQDPAPRPASDDNNNGFGREQTPWSPPARRFDKLRTILAARWTRLVQFVTFDKASSRIRKRLKLAGNKQAQQSKQEAMPSKSSPKHSESMPPLPVADGILTAGTVASEATTNSEAVSPSTNQPRASLFVKSTVKPATPAEAQATTTATEATTTVAVATVTTTTDQPAAPAPVVLETPEIVVEATPVSTVEVAPLALRAEPVKTETLETSVPRQLIESAASKPTPAEAPAEMSEQKSTLSVGHLPSQSRRIAPPHAVRGRARRWR